jgi:hypothetical protein
VLANHFSHLGDDGALCQISVGDHIPFLTISPLKKLATQAGLK